MDTAHAGSPETAERLLAHIDQLSPDLRGAAILAGDGEVLTSTGEASAWGEAARRVLEAADAARGEPAEHVHVASEDGEVFALRESGLTMICATGRFPLASLMVFDMRTLLRELARPGAEGAPA